MNFLSHSSLLQILLPVLLGVCSEKPMAPEAHACFHIHVYSLCMLDRSAVMLSISSAASLMSTMHSKALMRKVRQTFPFEVQVVGLPLLKACLRRREEVVWKNLLLNGKLNPCDLFLTGGCIKAKKAGKNWKDERGS